MAFSPGQGSVSLTTDCVPDAITVQGNERSRCTVEAENTGFGDSRVDLASNVSRNLLITSVTGAARLGPRTVALAGQQLAGMQPGVPSVAPGSLFGYLPMADFGVSPSSIGDEEALNFGIPEFTYAGETYSTVGVTSNGYAVVGGAEGAADVSFEPQDLPDPARPNNVLAPYWTDLDGTGAPGIYAAIISDSDTGESWFVSEWQVNVFGTTELKTSQLWIGLNGSRQPRWCGLLPVPGAWRCAGHRCGDHQDGVTVHPGGDHRRGHHRCHQGVTPSGSSTPGGGTGV